MPAICRWRINGETPDNSLPSHPPVRRPAYLLAAIVALTLLITIVMPSEYGIDPTGAGRLPGLKHMGEINMQLAAEIAADQQISVGQSEPSATLEKVNQVQANSPANSLNNASELSISATTPTPEVPATGTQRHQMLIILKPNEAAEIKREMRMAIQFIQRMIFITGMAKLAR